MNELDDYVAPEDRARVRIDAMLVRAGWAVQDSMHAYGTQLRTTLIEKGLFVETGPHLRLTEDYVFASPSTAAMIMLGRTSNGRVEWKTADGRTLKELQTADTASEAS